MNKNGFPTECECKPALIYDAEVGKCVIKQKTALCTKSLPPQCKCDDKKYAYDEKAKNCIFKPSVEKNVQSDIEEDIFAEDGSEDDLDSPMKPAKETRK